MPATLTYTAKPAGYHFTVAELNVLFAQIERIVNGKLDVRGDTLEADILGVGINVINVPEPEVQGDLARQPPTPYTIVVPAGYPTAPSLADPVEPAALPAKVRASGLAGAVDRNTQVLQQVLSQLLDAMPSAIDNPQLTIDLNGNRFLRVFRSQADNAIALEE